MLMEDDVRELIAYLEGTCQSLDEACSTLFNEGSEILTEEDLILIDYEIFHCESCGWWYSIDRCAKSDDEMICDYCVEDLENEENYYE